jgi:hypothetical protein
VSDYDDPFNDAVDDEFYPDSYAADDVTPFATSRAVPDAEQELRHLIEDISRARSMPMSQSVILHREDTLAALHHIIASLPEEIRLAREQLRSREELILAANADRDAILDEARAEAARRVDRSELVRLAKARAQQIENEARLKGRQMVIEAEDYVDRQLVGLQRVLDRLMRTVDTGRDKIHEELAPSYVREAENSFLDQPAAPVEDRGWRTAPMADPWGEAPPPAPAPVSMPTDGVFFDQEADD